jgi:hypothetical protein
MQNADCRRKNNSLICVKINKGFDHDSVKFSLFLLSENFNGLWPLEKRKKAQLAFTSNHIRKWYRLLICKHEILKYY